MCELLKQLSHLSNESQRGYRFPCVKEASNIVELCSLNYK